MLCSPNGSQFIFRMFFCVTAREHKHTRSLPTTQVAFEIKFSFSLLFSLLIHCGLAILLGAQHRSATIFNFPFVGSPKRRHVASMFA